MKIPACLLAILLVSAHCGEGCGCRSGARIIDGTAVPESNFPTVGRIGGSSSFYCTGTLIAPRFVLCAAHCFVSGTTGALVVGQTAVRFRIGGVVYNSVHVTVHPTYLGNLSQHVEGAIDLSIVELDQDVPGITPSPLFRQTPTVGAVLTLVGYGVRGAGVSGAGDQIPPFGTVDTGTSPIDVVTPTFLKWNFENKSAPDKESNTAPGDSGGPQFLTVNGVLTLASVTSGGVKADATFGDLSYNIRVDANADWIDSIINVNNFKPAIQSVSATPNPAGTAQLIAFTAGATDVNNDPLTYTWDFQDGTFGASASVTHSYTVPGIYNVTCAVSDGKVGTVSQPLVVKVLAPEVGSGNDSDGDGFSDDFENTTAADPNSAASTPTGAPISAATVKVLNIAKTTIKLNFAMTASDTIAFSGTLDVPASFKPAGQQVIIDAGGVTKVFALGDKGSAKTADGSVKIQVKTVKGVTSAKYTIALGKGSFAAALVDEGLANTNAKKSAHTVVYAAVFNIGVYKLNKNVVYTAKLGKTGMAK